MQKINLNDKIEVELTDFGKEIYRKYIRAIRNIRNRNIRNI